jgi:methionyl-tRNA formyltransferase
VRVVFFGTPELAVPSLEAVHARHEVVAVVCQPDKPKGRSGTPTPPPVKAWALEHGLPVHQPVKLNDGAFEAWLRDLAPDAGAIVAYGRILKQPILEVPRHGIFNMHPSLLPKWRGPSPMQSAILHGDKETGVTIIRLCLDMDAGDILLQERTMIDGEENAIALTERLSRRGAKMLADALDMVEAGTATYAPQQHDEATYCHMLSKQDGYMDWTHPAQELHNLVRGALPWPVAQCMFRGEHCKVYESRVVEGQEALPGTVTHVAPDAVHVATGAGSLALLKFQAPGKRVMTMREFLAGTKIQAGEIFDNPGMEGSA